METWQENARRLSIDITSDVCYNLETALAQSMEPNKHTRIGFKHLRRSVCGVCGWNWHNGHALLTKVPEVKVPVKNCELRYSLVVIDKLANVVSMKERLGGNAFNSPNCLVTNSLFHKVTFFVVWCWKARDLVQIAFCPSTVPATSLRRGQLCLINK
jgi:hypothetical protein